MKNKLSSITIATVVIAAVVQQATAGSTLVATTGAGNQPSTLVVINTGNGKLVKTIGPVGFTVNGMAWDPSTGTLYATTSVGDPHFHGLITINTSTGAGTPVNPDVDNFGLPVGIPPAPQKSPIHSLTIDSTGQLVGWYDEVPPATSDTFVRIDKNNGIAEEFPNTGINTVQNGLSFGDGDVLWNIDSPFFHTDGTITQTAYIIDPFSGKPGSFLLLSPPTPAALGDINPDNHLYYGLNFNVLAGNPLAADLVVVNLRTGAVRTVGPTVDGLHVLTFIKPPLR